MGLLGSRAVQAGLGGLLVLFAAGCGNGEPLTRARSADGRYISWKEHRIDDEKMGTIPIRGASAIQMADLDKDGFLDIVSAHKDSGHIRVAFGSRHVNEWFRLSLAEGSDFVGAVGVTIEDLDRDGFPDVVVSCGAGRTIGLRNPGGKVRGWPWARAPLPEREYRSPAGSPADINGDGKPDMMVGGRSVAWLLNPGPAGAPGTRYEITRLKKGVYDAFLPRDMDADGDIDFVAVRRDSGEYDGVVWLEQVRSRRPARSFTPARESDN